MDARGYINGLERVGVLDYKRTASLRVAIPPGRGKPWRVEKFKIEMNMTYLRLAREGRAPGIGEFTRLYHDDRGTVMSDTIPEVQDLLGHIDRFRGRVLISGLGLGLALHLLTKHKDYRKQATSITVLEIDKKVIKLVAPHYTDQRITIINADAREWRPPKGIQFDFAWHDIWDGGVTRSDTLDLRRHHRKWIVNNNQHCWSV